MATSIIHGKAQVQGILGSFDAILYATQQTGSVTQDYEEEIVKDSGGFDISWKAQNEKLSGDFKLKLIGDTLAHAMAPGTAVNYAAGTAGAAVSSLGQPFLAPLACVNFTASSPTCASFTGAYQYVSGAQLSQSNTGVAELDISIRRYADSTQNTLANTVPS